MHSLGVDLSLLRQQPLRQLFFGHLEAEDGARLIALQRRVETDVESQRRVMDQDVLSDEVIGLWNSQVVTLMFSGTLARDDFVPIDVWTCDLAESDVF